MSRLSGKGQLATLAHIAERLSAASGFFIAALTASRAERGPIYKDLSATLAEADSASRLLLNETQRAFYTPIDRVLLTDLAAQIPDVIETLDAAVHMTVMHRLRNLSDLTIAAAGHLQRACEVTQAAVNVIGSPRSVPPQIAEIRRLVREASGEIRGALAEVMASTPDPKRMMRERDVLTHLQHVGDALLIVAGTLRSLSVRESS